MMYIYLWKVQFYFYTHNKQLPYQIIYTCILFINLGIAQFAETGNQ